MDVGDNPEEDAVGELMEELLKKLLKKMITRQQYNQLLLMLQNSLPSLDTASSTYFVTAKVEFTYEVKFRTRTCEAVWGVACKGSWPFFEYVDTGETEWSDWEEDEEEEVVVVEQRIGELDQGALINDRTFWQDIQRLIEKLSKCDAGGTPPPDPEHDSNGCDERISRRVSCTN
ncbi:MAG: hypothetical protein JEZ07_19705 [Phycisphaerae bacterium]|nr:hypothetical protein [Phycisphaerae bacterium]